jgi:hypothetical protein
MKKVIAFLIAAFVISVSVDAQKKEAPKQETTKQAAVKTDNAAKDSVQFSDTTQFALIGNLKAFQILMATLENPDKALHQDVKNLSAWIMSAQAINLPKQEDNSKSPPKK